MMFRKPEDFLELMEMARSNAKPEEVQNRFVERGGVKIESETPCTMIGKHGTMAQVRVVAGTWEGTQGWVRADQVSVQGE